MRSLPLLLILPALLPSRPAEACSPPPCWPGAFVPGDASTIPANAPGLYWRPGRSGGGAASTTSSVRLTTVSAPSTALPFTATALPSGDYVIVPSAPLVEGTAYVLEDQSTCGGSAGSPRVTFTAGPAAPLPTSLGTVSTIGHGTRLGLEVATASGSCSTMIDAVTFSIELSPSAEAIPWSSLLLYETLVDDQPWAIQESINISSAPGESWKGRARDLLFRTCTPSPDASYPGMSPGTHDVAFRASLPGGQPISTPPSPVELMCDDVMPPGDEISPEDDSSNGCASSTPAASSWILIGLVVLFGRRCKTRTTRR
jgi:hypothetical protein